MEVEYHPAFGNDLGAATDFYIENGGSELASAFLAEVSLVLDQIEAQPERFSKIHNDIRRCRLGRFRSYAVFYKLKGNKLYIGGLIHGARNPLIWLERFEK